MSFVLPGNQRQLRFTGEAKALKDENSNGSGTPGAGLALGKPRVRKATTPPPALVPARSSRNTGITPASPGQQSISRPGNPGSISRPGSYNASIRAKAVDQNDRDWDGEDQQSTMAFDREGADVLPGGMPSHRSSRGPAAVSVAPIPHFRPASPAVQTVIVPNQSGSTEIRSTKGAPLALWIFAAILAGILSYHVTPAVMSHFEAPPPPAKAGG